MAANAHVPLDPYPDELYGVSESVGLCFLAGLHRLSPRERAVVALTDVAGFSAAEVAEMLETTEGWVERTLRLARGALDAAATEEPAQVGEQQLVERLRIALEDRDRVAIESLLADDVTLTCTRRWATYRNRSRVARILSERMDDSGGLRLLPTRANGQPAFGCYGETDGRANGLLAVTLRGPVVACLTRFWDNDVLPYFGLPETLRG
jgi:RNA polymerase sigma-70 factor, ECF subfamily